MTATLGQPRRRLDEPAPACCACGESDRSGYTIRTRTVDRPPVLICRTCNQRNHGAFCPERTRLVWIASQ
jgi:hypothetical protein